MFVLELVCDLVTTNRATARACAQRVQLMLSVFCALCARFRANCAPAAIDDSIGRAYAAMRAPVRAVMPVVTADARRLLVSYTPLADFALEALVPPC